MSVNSGNCSNSVAHKEKGKNHEMLPTKQLYYLKKKETNPKKQNQHKTPNNQPENLTQNNPSSFY